ITEAGGYAFELIDTLGIRFLMDAVEAGYAPLQVGSYRLISRQHEFFNQPVGPVALGGRDALHQSPVVKLDDRLREVKVDAAPFYPLAIENLRQFVHQVKIPGQGRIAAPQLLVAFDDGVDVGVGHALRGANHAFSQFVVHDFALRIDLHHAGEHQPLHLRPQAADVRG